MFLLHAYLWLCAIIFIGVVGWGLWEDLTGRSDPKFGHNVLINTYGVNWFFWFIVFLMSCPFINLIVVIAMFTSYCRRRHHS